MKKHFFSKIKGVSFFQENIKSLKEGQPLKIVIEYDNKYDPNALRLETLDDIPVGYISRKFNKNLKYRLEQGKKYNITVANIYEVPNTNLKGVNIKVENTEDGK